MLKILSVLLLTLTTTVHAQSKIGLMGSLLYTVPEIETPTGSSVDEGSEIGYGIGMRALIPLTSGLFFRSGAGLVQKNFNYTIETAGVSSDTDLSFTYLTVPATLYFTGLDQKFGVFGGTALNAKLADDCETDSGSNTCQDLDDESLIFPVILGFDFILTDSFSMEFSYEHGFMETADDIKVSSAVLSFIYNLD